MTRIGLIGTGWRSEFFVRVAQALPEHFALSGVVSRTPERAAAVAAAWGVDTFPTLEALLESGAPDYVIVSVPQKATVEHLEACAAAGIPALCETPPAPDLEGLRRVTELAAGGARFQVAEQYPFQPLHAARIALTDAGAIGRVSMASISFSHGYHAFSIMRRHLAITGESARLRAATVRGPIETGGTRAGPRSEAGLTEEVRTTALVEFPDRLGLYDFGENQHRSYVRRLHVNLRGSKGEIADAEMQLVRGLDEVVTIPLRREVAGQDGDLTGHTLKGISLADGWVWRNPFPEARLPDDEIAVAQCMAHMAEYVAGGPPFYGVADAAQDHYLYLALQEAARTGEPVVTDVQPWADQMLPAPSQGA